MDEVVPPPMCISVLVATRNAAGTLQHCIESVLGQRNCAVELLIADAASTDGTVAICRKYAARLAYFRSEPDTGVYDAWNKLLPLARGRWLAFLGADDYLPGSDTLARMLHAAESRPAGCRLVYGRVHYVDDGGRCVYREGAAWNECAAQMRFRNSIPHIGTLHERSIFDDGACFDASYRIAGDYDLIRRETLRNGAHFADDVVAAHACWGGLSTSGDHQWQCIREVGTIIRRQDGRHPPLAWFLRCGHVLLRQTILRIGGNRTLARYDHCKSLVFRRRARWGSASLNPEP